MGQRRPVLPLLLPSKGAKQIRVVHSRAWGASMGGDSAGTLVPWEMRRCSALPSGVPTHIPAVPSSHPYKSGEIRSAVGLGSGSWKTDKFSWCTLFLTCRLSRRVFLSLSRKIHPVQLQLCWSKSVVQVKSTEITHPCFPGLSKWALPIFIHCMSLEQTEDIKCFVLAQAEGEKKKLHLIDRSLGFWSRSCVWLPRRWHSSSGRVVKGHLLANCLFGLLRAASWKTEEMRIRGIPADRKTSNCTL